MDRSILETSDGSGALRSISDLHHRAKEGVSQTRMSKVDKVIGARGSESEKEEIKRVRRVRDKRRGEDMGQ